MIIGLDVETSTKEKGHVHHPDNFLVSYSISSVHDTTFHYYLDPDFLSIDWSKVEEVIGFNFKFDYQWLLRNEIEIPEQVRIYDVSLAEQILTAQRSPMVSLNEVCESYGVPTKIDIVKGYWEQGVSTEDIPVPIVREYNNDDAEKNLILRDIQLKLLTPEQLRLVYEQGEDLRVLARAEMHGVKFDKDRAKRSVDRYQGILRSCEASLNQYIPAGIPASDPFNWDSGDQLSALLYGGTITYDEITPENRVYGKTAQFPGEPYVYNHHRPVAVTFDSRFSPIRGTEVKKTKGKEVETRFYQVDDVTLKQLTSKDPANRRLLGLLAEKAKVTKVLESFQGIFKRIEQYKWGDYLHGQFNQNIAVTGRLSSSNPNMQNSAEDVDECLVSRFND